MPGYLDAMTAVALLGQATDRIEIGTAVVPIQTRHPIPMAQQALTTQVACAGRFTLGIGPSHHWIVADQLGLPLRPPGALVRDYLEVLNAAFAGPGPVDVDNDTFRVHSPMDVTDADRDADPARRARSGDAAHRRRAHRRHHSVDGRRARGRRARRPSHHHGGAAMPDGRSRASSHAFPSPCARDSDVDSARVYASEVLGHADFSPNYVRLLEHGDAEDVGDTMAAGDEDAVLARLRRYRDAGVTDLAARIVPLGADSTARTASIRRTRRFLASICPEVVDTVTGSVRRPTRWCAASPAANGDRRGRPGAAHRGCPR